MSRTGLYNAITPLKAYLFTFPLLQKKRFMTEL